MDFTLFDNARTWLPTDQYVSHFILLLHYSVHNCKITVVESQLLLKICHPNLTRSPVNNLKIQFPSMIISCSLQFVMGTWDNVPHWIFEMGISTRVNRTSSNESCLSYNCYIIPLHQLNFKSLKQGFSYIIIYSQICVKSFIIINVKRMSVINMHSHRKNLR